MLWVKALHIIAMVTWFAGLFYLPRLFVYHAMTDADDKMGRERFRVMEKKLFIIMTIGGVLTAVFGVWLMSAGTWMGSGWLHAKLTLVAILIAFHVYCWKLVRDFKQERNIRGHAFYRWLNEFPVLLLISVVILAVVKPF